MPQANLALEQRVLALALRTKACSRCRWVEGYFVTIGGTQICTFCGGTGQMAEFPMLREDCIGVLIDAEQSQTLEDYCCICCGWLDGKFFHSEDCDPCKGRGWLPVITKDALLEAGKPWHIGIWWDTKGYSARYTHPAMSRPDMLRNVGGTPLEALVAALEAALGIEEAS